MIAVAIATVLAATPTTDSDLRCAAIAWQVLRQSANNAERANAARLAYMFSLGRLTAEAPDGDWVGKIDAQSKTFLALPPVGAKPGDLPCSITIKRIVRLPPEIAP